VTDVIGTARDVHGPGWKSRRVVLAGEGPDYPVHETTLEDTVSASRIFGAQRGTSRWGPRG
jgi:hypothetical protein